MHGGPISHINTGRKSAGNGHPPDGHRLPLTPLNGCSADLRPQPAFDECPQWLAQFGRPLLSRNKQIVREIDGSFHTGKHIPVFMAGQPKSDPAPLSFQPAEAVATVRGQ